MTLTITGKPETILGVMHKLGICDAKWNVTSGFTVEMDKCEPESTRKTDPRGESKFYVKKCKVCGKEFRSAGPRTEYCPECKAKREHKENSSKEGDL